MIVGLKYCQSCLLFLLALAMPLATYCQNIGYSFTHYVPNSERVSSHAIPITPAILSFTDWVKNSVENEIKELPKKNEYYEEMRVDILKKATIHITSAFMNIVEFESLRPFEYEDAKLSIFYFLDCWEKKNFKTKKNNFCKGCWVEYIERERFYYNKFAALQD